MEDKSFNYLKIMGMLAAAVLIIFGSIDNIWRTTKLAWNKVVKE